MSPAIDVGQIHLWLSTLYGTCDGLIHISSTGNWNGRACRTVDEAVTYIQTLDKRRPEGIYARATTLSRRPERRGVLADTREVVGLWADMDIATGVHKHHVCDGTPCQTPAAAKDLAAGRNHGVNFTPLIPDQATCLEIIERSGLPAPTEWVHSGGGMYPWWLLVDPVDYASRPDLVDLSANWQRIIGLTAKQLGYHYGTGAGDLVRILRIPGTINRKDVKNPVPARWLIDQSTSQPYPLGQLADAAAESLARLEPPKPTLKLAPSARAPRPTTGTRVGDAYNAATTWEDILTADGATLAKGYNGGYQEWVRPGKDPHRGISATTNYMNSDLLKVMSDAWMPLEQGKTYTRFGYYAATRCNGDFSRATRELAALGYGDPVPPPGTTPPGDFDAHYQPSVVAAIGTVATTSPAQPLTRTWTDSGIADRMEDRHGRDWIHIAPREKKAWMRWDGSMWVTDRKGTVTSQIDTLVADAFLAAEKKRQEAELAEDRQAEKEALELLKAIRPALGNGRQLGATAIFARRPQIAREPDDLDRVKNKLTATNCVVNLDTFEAEPFDRELYATRKLGVAYHPDAKAPKWDKFLAECLPDPQVRDYLQRMAGYTLTGNPIHKALVILQGAPDTGKSQVIIALKEIFGSFEEGTKEQTFRQSESPSSASPGLQKLRGARLVTASEFSRYARLDETLIKQIAGGGDSIESRGLFVDEESWKPDFVMWIATNFVPNFSAEDNAIWRRVKLIHFPVVFGQPGGPKMILDIARKLVAEEGPGILNWILDGVRAYRERGLVEPDTLRENVINHQRSLNPVAQFIDDAISGGSLELDPAAMIPATQLYNWFLTWCQGEGIAKPLAPAHFGRKLRGAGDFEQARDSTGNVRMWRGLKAGKAWMGSGSPTFP